MSTGLQRLKVLLSKNPFAKREDAAECFSLGGMFEYGNREKD